MRKKGAPRSIQSRTLGEQKDEKGEQQTSRPGEKNMEFRILHLGPTGQLSKKGGKKKKTGLNTQEHFHLKNKGENQKVYRLQHIIWGNARAIKKE